MTRKKAFELAIQACKETWNEKTCAEIIKALEQEPCDDAISRQAAIKAIDEKAKRIKNEDTLNGLAGAVGILFDLPSYNSIKTELSGDCISRQAVLDIITEQERLASDRVRDTPSSLGNGLHTWVNPAYTRYSAQLSERSQFKTMIQTVPPVIPQPKTGHWIMGKFTNDDIRYNDISYKCNKCGKVVNFEENYCPNCGTKMVDPQERNKQNG